MAESVADIPEVEQLFAHLPAFGPAIIVPLGGAEAEGVLIAANRAGCSSFSSDAIELTVAFALQVALTLQLADARQAQQQLELYADRDRIARDLHDQVIQRLFATGMSLESLVRQVPGPARQKLHTAVDDLDRSIRDIRSTIYALQTTPDAPVGVRKRLTAVVYEASGGSGLRLDLRVGGPLDTTVPPETADHAAAVLREAVTNVVRHAKATTLSVSIVANDRLRIEVGDDGVGLPAEDHHRSGLTNMTDRALELGGTFTTSSHQPGGGTALIWDVPLGPKTLGRGQRDA